ncbi:MAG: hypothetical protein IJ493_01850 [Clostridia bacterium]|nr:hypothetical protein [Clostridia bacterium]
MFTCQLTRGALTVDFAAGCVVSLTLDGRELVSERLPLFSLRLRDHDGSATLSDAFAASSCDAEGGRAVYHLDGLDVTVTLTADNGRAAWDIAVENHTGLLIEYVDFPNIALPKLAKNGGGTILFPYNEGALVDDLDKRQRTGFRHVEPEYPSHGSYAMFPYMVHSQFLCYLTGGAGLYLGAHDERRGVKSIDFFAAGEGVFMRFRSFCGVGFGEGWTPGYPMVWQTFEGDWQDGAEIYRDWFEAHKPDNVKKILENPALPEWYADSPLVISYPVRGIHDMDKMDPNALFPYENALPLIDKIAERTGWRILVLLMHWEGTAPWAPPYVWPPFGGEECFLSFLEKLHERGNLLGVYCSGFGFTEQSNLIESYNCVEEIQRRGLMDGFCAAPGGEVLHSRICTGQRSGYDLCVKSEKGREVLAEAYEPLFKSGVDYAQILDQNHGGSQYFCYSEKHNHPPAPGPWMTEAMRELLDGWNHAAPNMLFGCESSSSEPYIGNLLFSDNRYELNWHFGEPVPLFAYLYHEYLRNFQGNQVSCGLKAMLPDGTTVDTMRCRMAYSFAAGDSMTLVVTPSGKLMANWGNHDFEHVPDMDKALEFAANMHRFYESGARPFLHAGRMIKPLPCECGTVIYPGTQGDVVVPKVYTTAWEADGRRVQIFVNHTDEAVVCRVDEREIAVPAMDAVMMER